MIMARLIGSGTTDANGRVSVSYTGTGAGKLQIIALSGDLSTGALTSNTYDLWDLLFYDSGFEDSTSLASKWTHDSSKLNRSSDDNGTKLTVTNATTSTCIQYTNTTFTGDFEATVYVEHDASLTAVRFGVQSGSTRKHILTNGNYYVKLVRENGTTTAYYSEDGETWSQKNMNGTEPSSSTVSIYIGLYNTTSTGMSFIYRDLKVYNI